MKRLSIIFLLLWPTLLLADVPNVYVNADWSALTVGTDPDGSGPATELGVDAFATITPAINAVAIEGTVHVAAGTYTEQIEISNNLSLEGSGVDTIIESPTLLPFSFNTGVLNKPIIWVHDAADVEIRDLLVDGLSLGNGNFRFMGIAFQNAGGTIDSVEIQNVENTPLDGSQHGIGIYVRNMNPADRSITIINTNIHDYQKNGIAVIGERLIATITDNTVVGSGDVPEIAQNGIQLSYGGTGTIQRNIIRNNSCTSVVGHCTDDPTLASADTAAGILIFSPGNTLLDISDNTLENNQCNLCALSSTDYYAGATEISLDIHDNTIDGGQLGISLYDLDGTVPLTATILQNTITHQQYGLFVRDDTLGDAVSPSIEAHLNRITDNTVQGAWSNTPVDATLNWWGCAEGSQLTPGPCDSHTLLVTTGPWLTTPDISGTGPTSDDAGSGGSSGSSGSSGGSGGAVSTGGSGGDIGGPSGETSGISGTAGIVGSGGAGGSGGTGGNDGEDIGHPAGVESGADSAGCSCHMSQN